MPRSPIASMIVSLTCLALGPGCCCCQRGLSMRGDWSLQIDRLPGDCGHGHCGQTCCEGEHGSFGLATGPEVAHQAPVVTPQFQPVPTRPVDNVMAPPEPALAEAPATPQEQQVSVLQRPNLPEQKQSSWMFIRQQPPASSHPELAQRRQLMADAWTAPRRR